MNMGPGDLCYRPQNRWLRREADGGRYGQLLRYLVLGAVPLAVLTTAAWSNLEAVRLGYRVEELRLQKEDLEDEIRQRRLEIGRLTDPLRVERTAREVHGLVPAENFVVLDLAVGAALDNPRAEP